MSPVGKWSYDDGQISTANLKNNNLQNRKREEKIDCE